MTELKVQKENFLTRLFGNKDFLKGVLIVFLPILIQNAITNFVSLLDNIMVGKIGTEQMSGVAICNQALFVFNLCIFGGVSGVGIFTAQYFGAKNYEGMRDTMRYMLYLCLLLVLIATMLFLFLDDEIISLFLHEGEQEGDLVSTLAFGKQYLKIMVIGLPAFALTQVYANVLRSANKTTTPMVAGLVAVAVNLGLNWVLIYGKLGAPTLGVEGAAIATVVSRYVEMMILLVYSHVNVSKLPYFKGVYKKLRLSWENIKKYTVKGFPILLNETLWSLGMTMLVQCYSVRGLNVVAAINISNTLVNLFNAGMISMGASVGIIIGNLLGANKLEEAKKTDSKLIALSVALSLTLGGLMSAIAEFFPLVYNTTEQVRRLATYLIWISAAIMPVMAFLNAAYFTIRAGGKTFITFIFDNGMIWIINVPLALILSRLTSLPIIPMYAIINACDILKMIFGIILLKRGTWCRCIVEPTSTVTTEQAEA